MYFDYTLHKILRSDWLNTYPTLNDVWSAGGNVSLAENSKRIFYSKRDQC